MLMMPRMSMTEFCCPLSYYLCHEADQFCMKSDDYGLFNINEPYCVECYYCLSIPGFFLDVLCCPINLCCHHKAIKKNDATNKYAASAV